MTLKLFSFIKWFILISADRFDFVLNANQTAGTYYIFAQSVNDFCGGLRQVAVLRYASSGTNPIRRAPPPTGDLGVVRNYIYLR